MRNHPTRIVLLAFLLLSPLRGWCSGLTASIGFSGQYRGCQLGISYTIINKTGQAVNYQDVTARIYTIYRNQQTLVLENGPINLALANQKNRRFYAFLPTALPTGSSLKVVFSAGNQILAGTTYALPAAQTMTVSVNNLARRGNRVIFDVTPKGPDACEQVFTYQLFVRAWSGGHWVPVLNSELSGKHIDETLPASARKATRFQIVLKDPKSGHTWVNYQGGVSQRQSKPIKAPLRVRRY